MKLLKQICGFLCLLLSVGVAYFSIMELALPKLLSGKQEDAIFGGIVLFVLTPIVVIGLALFGYYAVRGEYEEN